MIDDIPLHAGPSLTFIHSFIHSFQVTTETMSVVKKIEAVGSGSGKTSQEVKITKSGVL